MDGFPQTIAQAEALFSNNGNDIEESSLHIEDDNSNALNVNALPEYVVILEATDEFLRERVLNMSESEIVARSYDQQGFVKKLAVFREQNSDDKTVLNFFEERDHILLHPLPCTTLDKMMTDLKRMIGKPRNYGPSKVELEAQQRLAAQQEVCSGLCYWYSRCIGRKTA